MSTPAIVLLEKLAKCRQTVSDAFYETRISRTEDNALDIEMLRHFRLLSPDVRDAFRLRGSFRQFLNTTLSTERLYAVGANIGAYFGRLSQLIEEHAMAFNDGRDADSERYETEIREAISDVADAIEDDLAVLEMHVSTKFAAVATLAEKRRQNLFYLARTQDLVNLLEDFHFSSFEEQLAGNAELALSFRSLLEDRLPAFREQLKTILQQLSRYLFEFRQIEQRAKSLRRLSMHFARHPDWHPSDWDSESSPPTWVCLAKPLMLAAGPDTRSVENEEVLSELAARIPAIAAAPPERRPEGGALSTTQEATVRVPVPTIRRALHVFLREALAAGSWLSAKRWWLEHPAVMADIGLSVWLLRLLTEIDKRDVRRPWKHYFRTRSGEFSGNIAIHDIMVAGLDIPYPENA